MLGRAFESLMAAHERRVTGAYYTPQALVAHVADQALASAVEGVHVPPDTIACALAGTPLSDDQARALAGRLPGSPCWTACGSGAFLVYLLERITLLRRAAGDARASRHPPDVLAHAILASM